MMALTRVLASIVAAVAVSAQTAVAPSIETRAGEPVIVLPAAMSAALRQFDPQFELRQWTDYPPLMWRRGCTFSPDCATNLFRITPRQTPFAVVGDFNGDRLLDVVIDGDNRTRGRRIVVLSERQSFVAGEVDSMSRIAAGIETSRSAGTAARDWYDGVESSLSSARPQTYRSTHEARSLDLKTDGFIVSYFEKSSVLYYLVGGTWRQYVLND